MAVRALANLPRIAKKFFQLIGSGAVPHCNTHGKSIEEFTLSYKKICKICLLKDLLKSIIKKQRTPLSQSIFPVPISPGVVFGIGIKVHWECWIFYVAKLA